MLDLAESAPTAAAPLVPIRYNLARALVLGGRADQAVPHLQWLIEAMQEMGLTSRVASAKSMLARSWREAGEHERAGELLEQANQLHQGLDDPGELAALRGEQAWLALARDDLGQAESFAREALNLARAIDYDRMTAESLGRLVDILARRGDYAEALALHREFAELQYNMLQDRQRSRLDTLEIRLGFQRQALELAELRQTTEVQALRLREESLRRRLAWAALLGVVFIALLLAVWQRANQQRLFHASRTDALTGLANRRHLTLQMQSLPNPDRAVVMLLDLDHFKRINDQHGHDIGDRVLLEVSAIIKQIADRSQVLCGRWGGEEFALFLPAADDEKTSDLAAQILAGIQSLRVFDDHQKAVQVTASLGFAPIKGLIRDSGQENWEAALKAADQLLYRAKNAGRNRGFGVWSTEPAQAVNPLALDSAIQSGSLRLIEVAT